MPTSNPVPLILIFTAIGFIVGALVIYLVMLNEGRKGTKSAETDLHNERNQKYQEIAGMWRERSGGKLAVWLDEKMATDSKSLDDAQRQRLESVHRELAGWLGLTPAAPAPVETQNLASLQTHPEQTIGAGDFASLQSPVETQDFASLPKPTGPRATPTPAQPAPAATPTPAPAPASDRPQSIVEQVNDILKEIVAGTPMEARMIRLSEDPRQGVVVWVGSDHFEGVEAVPDPAVKAVLREAGAEWERRTGMQRR